MKKVIISHPFKQHSFRTAIALEKTGKLYAYCTTVYDKKHTVLNYIKRFLKDSNMKKVNKRRDENIDENKVHIFCECMGLFSIFLNHFAKSMNLIRFYRRVIYKKYGKKVGKFVVKSNPDILICYDTTATECFKTIKKYKKENIILVLDMAAAASSYIKKIYEDEEEKFKIKDFKKEQRYLWNEKILSNIIQEFKYADYFIVASNFSKKSLIYNGVDENRIEIIPYGVDLDKFKLSESKNNSGILKIIFVGTIDVRKGLHHIFNVLKNINPSDLELNLYGHYLSNSNIYKKGKELINVNFYGNVPQDVLIDAYQSSDVMIFPSVDDGFGLAALEGMACGLPIICSSNAGISDIINKKNGFIFESGDEKKLLEIIKWCIENKNILKNMKKEARKTAEKYTWEKYEEKINNFIDQIKK